LFPNNITTNKYPYLFPYRFKLAFIATDGTAEAEMVCFAATAARIVGKSCDYVMRSITRGHNIPPPLAAIVSAKFTFTIKLTEDSYRCEKRTFVVNSVITSHGKQQAIPHLQPSAAPSKHVVRTPFITNILIQLLYPCLLLSYIITSLFNSAGIF
jgi:replication factor A1